jgi:DNA-binding protein YbaB
MVTVKVTGELVVQELKIKQDALGSGDGVEAEDLEMLEDMVLAAVNEALRSAQELAARKLGGVTGGLGNLGLPGL